MNTVDPLLLTFTCVLIVFILLGNLYFLAYYSHYADSLFGSAIMTKILLVSLFFVEFCVLIKGDWLSTCRDLNSHVGLRYSEYSNKWSNYDGIVLVNNIDDFSHISMYFAAYGTFFC
jgi:hypothetical protein